MTVSACQNPNRPRHVVDSGGPSSAGFLMSVQTTTPESYECSREGCTVTKTAPSLVEGSFCSERCAALETGANLLEHIKHDHRFCHACFRQLKEIERPPTHKALNVGPADHAGAPNTITNCLVGFQYLTEHAELGGRSRDFVETGEEQPPSGVDAVITGTVCTCGTTDHRDGYLREDAVVSVRRAARRLCEILGTLSVEGQHDKTVDARTLLTSLEDGEEWTLAIGRAVE